MRGARWRLGVIGNGKVQTVSGFVDTGELGKTLMHEHILCDLTSKSKRVPAEDEVVITLENVFDVTYRPNDYPGNHRLQDVDIALREVGRYAGQGGGTIVEMTTGGLEPDPLRLRRISEDTGVNIVLGAGFYTEPYQDEQTLRLDAEQLGEIMVAQLTEGAWGTDVRCGIIGEIGCSWPLTLFEMRSLQAAALAQRQTGASITVHPGRHPEAPGQILDILERAGADLTRTIIDHMERTYTSVEQVLALASRGCVVEYDFFGIEQSRYWLGQADLPTDWMRIYDIRRLFEAGLGSNVVISQDICTRSRLQSYGGHGYGHIMTNVIPLMRDRGFSPAEIDMLLVETPARLLTLA
ncbi:aryldialkylphosphatase [Rhizobium rhizophilum]|uniref:Aryldialkylphosphatase n=1 Tax=Rhizobium rhizophilum TaxID=1850373 RepID=A0ABY2R0P4_9HYPH|nr:aryldialkylphosphatase [Rhizobium rhizophilum]